MRTGQSRHVRGRRNLLRRLLARDGDKCCFCGDPLDIDTVTIDHIIPRSKGGNNGFENVRACCCICNGARGNGDAPDPIIRARILRTLTRKAEKLGVSLKDVIFGVADARRKFEERQYAPPWGDERCFEEKLAAQKQDEDVIAREAALGQKVSFG
jgi:hypothetical protein